MNRRTVLTTAAALPFAACAGQTTLTPAEIVTEAGTFVTGFAGAFAALTKSFPTLVPDNLRIAIQGYLGDAQSSITAINANLPATTGASTLSTILGYVNSALNILGGPPINGLIPAPFNEAIAAVAVLAPVLEAWVQSVIPSAAPVPPTVAAARAKVGTPMPTMTTAQALIALQKYSTPVAGAAMKRGS